MPYLKLLTNDFSFVAHMPKKNSMTTRSRGLAAADGPTEKLQKVLARRGLGSRREMEEWIRAARVTVNGVTASLGSRVRRTDAVAVDGRPVKASPAGRLPRVLLYHKPEGEIVSRDDPGGRTSVFEKVPPLRGAKWLAVGRLDFNTSGLLVLTDDGELANRMMHPRYELPREYAVRIRGRVAPADMERLRRGIPVEDGQIRLESIEEQGGEGANRWYRIVLREGRNRIVRRMFEALGLTVSRLMRIRFGPVSLPPRLTRGRFMELAPEEVRELLAAVGLATVQNNMEPPRRQDAEQNRNEFFYGRVPGARGAGRSTRGSTSKRK
jgi:23S rRNA pseudouridine2605 synthase